MGTKITPEMLQYVQKLVGSFGISVEGSNNNNTNGALSQEALSKRAQAAAQDPAFQRLKNQFASDFDFRYKSYVVFTCSSCLKVSMLLFFS